MSPVVDIIRDLTEPTIPIGEKRELGYRFSREFGWRPNDFLDVPYALPAANLIVERGLDNAAMLSFLPSDRRLADIQDDEQRSILGLSYNSLIDWHIWIDQESVQCFNNRFSPPTTVYREDFDHSDYSALNRRVFDQAVGRARNPNILALDGALLGTITTWKQILRLELDLPAANHAMSALFNAIILARAVEDFDTKLGIQSAITSLLERVKIPSISIGDAIEQLISERTGSKVTPKLFDRSVLKPFDHLSMSSRVRLVEGFYRHDAVPYDYDFSVMSKYALSKLYERYVSVMRDEESVQVPMFPSTHAPEEEWNKQLGGVYTPQYIASFFARYLRSRLPQEQFLKSSVADPACGSGVFLRAVMEQKLLASDTPPTETAGPALDSLHGIDIDKNAVAAASLSLALLHLAARGKLPEDLPITQGDSLECFVLPPNSEGSFDAVMVNPPFVRTERQSDAERIAIDKLTGVTAKGKLDMYSAFLVLSIRALRPGGFGCFVVPQTLLTSDNLKSLRDWIIGETWVHFIADLSAIRIFKQNVYVALLIIQRKSTTDHNRPPVSVVRCRRDVGLALDDFLDGILHRQTSSYLIFNARQESLSRATWSVPVPEEAGLLKKLESMPSLNDVAVVRQGAITGADHVFIVDAHEVPQGEEALYRPFLPERMIGRYALPSETGKRVLYPYVDGASVSASRLEKDFPITWQRLNEHKEELSKRSSSPTDPAEWWRPSRPRSPNDILAPKLVGPRVCLIPRFGIDIIGQWIVSHSLIVRPRPGHQDEESLLILAAVLNSSVAAWFIDLNGRKYRSGYNEVAVSLVRRLPIPEFNQIPAPVMQHVIALARNLAGSFEEFDFASLSSLDDIVLRNLYRLEDEELKIVKPQSFA